MTTRRSLTERGGEGEVHEEREAQVNTAVRGIVLSFAVLGALTVSAGAAPGEVIADWEMNDDRTGGMEDSSGNGFTGDIGDEVLTSRPTGEPGGLAYEFPGPHFASYNPEKLVLVPDDPDGAGPATSSALDPGTGPYAVTIRFRTTAERPNIVQKGQNNVGGGFWKLVLKSGWPRCHFEDSTGAIKAIGWVGGDPSYKVNDGQWHTLRCERTTDGVRVTLDAGTPDEATKFIRGTLGNINNTNPFMIGGKLYCQMEGVTCDFFRGQLDYVKVEKG